MLIDQLESIYARYIEVEQLLSSPEIAADVKEFSKLNKEYVRLKEIVLKRNEYISNLDNIKGAKEILQTETDAEMKEMARLEIEESEKNINHLEQEIKVLLIPKDPEDEKPAIIEIRSGTGGDEASLFAGDLYRMYQKYLSVQGWKHELIDVMEGSAGGYNKIVFSIAEPEAYGRLKFESGVHRVQRVPDTESQGRVHTSAATVAVLPEVDDVDVDLKMSDIRVDTYRASGAGGQHVNKTESAVRLTHIPTGIVSECQDGRSQHQNKERAFQMLRSRIYEKMQEELNKSRAAERKSLVSSGDRSAKIRTYNYPQSRVTDHRINLTLYNLPDVLNGELNEILDKLQMAENAEKMKKGGI